MAGERKSWLRRRTETALMKGFTRAYSTVRVDPDKFLLQLRAAYLSEDGRAEDYWSRPRPYARAAGPCSLRPAA